MDDCAPEALEFDDVIRFNEAINQALAESVTSFDAQIEQNHNLLLGMLGHDMRSPLQAIQITSSYLAPLPPRRESTAVIWGRSNVESATFPS